MERVSGIPHAILSIPPAATSAIERPIPLLIAILTGAGVSAFLSPPAGIRAGCFSLCLKPDPAAPSGTEAPPA